MNRRAFLGSSAASAARIAGANGSVRLGVIGCGGRGNYVARFMLEEAGVEVAVCADVDVRKARQTSERFGGRAEAVQDFRRLLERKDVDAVLVATPDHWHAGAAAMAARAGKHVYVEKPFTHNIQEGRALVEAAAGLKGVFMAGLQHRSAPHLVECAELVRSGALGKVHFVRIWNAVNMGAGGAGSEVPTEPPAELDWDYFCGPAPLRPYSALRAGPTYRAFWDYSGGYITDFGAHRFGTVHHVMTVDAPKTVNAAGGRFVLTDSGETPDLLQVTYEYDGFILSYEGFNANGQGLPRGSSGLKHYNERGRWDRPNGMAFHGTQATLFADRIGYELYPEALRPGSTPPPTAPKEPVFKQGADATRLHARSFIGHIRNGTKPDADAEFGHRVTSAALLGNVSLRSGLKIGWDAAKEDVDAKSAAARQWLGRRARPKWDFVRGRA